jgi:hypothetical protein
MTRLVSSIVSLETTACQRISPGIRGCKISNLGSLGAAQKLSRARKAQTLAGTSPPVDKAVISNHYIAPVIRAEWWLDDTVSAHPAEEIRKQLGAGGRRLGPAELIRVEVIVRVCLAAGLVPGIKELWEVGVVQHA